MALCVEREVRRQSGKWERDPGSGPCSDPKGLRMGHGLGNQVSPWFDSHEAVRMTQGRERTVQPAHVGNRK